LAAKLAGGYTPSSRDGEAKLVLDLPDLSRFSTIAGLVPTGRSHLELSARARNDDLKVDWQGTLDELGLPGMPPGLARQTVAAERWSGTAARPSWRLDAIRMASDAFTFEMSGRGKATRRRDRPVAGAGEARRPSRNVGGSATAKGKVVLKPAGGDLISPLISPASAGAASPRASWRLCSTRRLEGDAVSGSIKANGDLANQPVTLDGRFRSQGDGGLLVPSLAGGWASAAIDVKDLAVTPTGATGSGHIRMAHLEDLAPLLGTDLAAG